MESGSNHFKSALEKIKMTMIPESLVVEKLKERVTTLEGIDRIKMKGEIPQGLSFNQIKLQAESSIYVCSNYNTKLAGFPIGAGNYGTLITLNPQKVGYSSWRCTQIYIPVEPYKTGVYIRNDSNDWSKISAVKVEGVSEAN